MIWVENNKDNADDKLKGKGGTFAFSVPLSRIVATTTTTTNAKEEKKAAKNNEIH